MIYDIFLFLILGVTSIMSTSKVIIWRDLKFLIHDLLDVPMSGANQAM